MKKMTMVLMAGLLTILMTNLLHAQTGKTVPLFGEKLENAVYDKDVWKFNEQGELTAVKDSVIWTKNQYGSCTVSFEYKLSKRSNGGFLIQCNNKKDWIPNTIEIQLLDDAGSKPNYHGNAAFYGYQAPTEVLTKPAGEWNKMEVTCCGRSITIVLNGKKVNTIDTSKWTDAKKSPCGKDIEKKFQGHSLASALPYGYIGLQGLHGKAPICYRNLTITPSALPADIESWPLLFGEKLQNADYDPKIWSIDKEGVLRATKDDAIWSKEKYENYQLYLEFKNTVKSNSGVVIKCSDKKNWIPNALEVQIYDSFGKVNPEISDCASVYGRCAPFFNACRKPGEWNQMVVQCQGDIITINLNGEHVLRMDKSQYKDKIKNPDGTEAYPWLRAKAPADLDNNGYIGIQGLHAKSPVAYRNVRIKAMK